MNLTYSKNGDYYIPNIKLDNENYKPLGKYASVIISITENDL